MAGPAVRGSESSLANNKDRCPDHLVRVFVMAMLYPAMPILQIVNVPRPLNLGFGLPHTSDSIIDSLVQRVRLIGPILMCRKPVSDFSASIFIGFNHPVSALFSANCSDRPQSAPAYLAHIFWPTGLCTAHPYSGRVQFQRRLL